MATRRPASLSLFVLGCILDAGALAMLFAAYNIPSQGMEDLGRIVGAMLLVALSMPVFLFALVAARGERMPRWLLVGSWAGAALGLIPAVALVSARF